MKHIDFRTSQSWPGSDWMATVIHWNEAPVLGTDPVHEVNVQNWKQQDPGLFPDLVCVPQLKYPCSRAGPGLPVVICPGPAEPPPRSVWWCVGQSTAAAAGCCLSERPLESVGGPWTCGHWGCGASRNACHISRTRTPGRPRPCVWSCDILVTLADDTGSHTPHTYRRGNNDELYTHVWVYSLWVLLILWGIKLIKSGVALETQRQTLMSVIDSWTFTALWKM